MFFARVKTDEEITKMYENINEYFPDINRDMVDNITYKFNEIIDAMYEKLDLPEHLIKYNDRAYITKRIVQNENAPTATSTNTVLSLITAMIKFNIFYNENPKTLFSNTRINDFLICAVSDFSFKQKIFNIYTAGHGRTGPPMNEDEYLWRYWLINDFNLTNEYMFFMNVDVREALRLFEPFMI